jgi:hypothetical protein
LILSLIIELIHRRRYYSPESVNVHLSNEKKIYGFVAGGQEAEPQLSSVGVKSSPTLSGVLLIIKLVLSLSQIK